ncbi:sugar ABC transporter permease [Cohnella sp. CIP 111063]|uniref:carbohydrate ABC transporter permease n=1 Tax=unclassified Cohnella TaxID=2636738 RepID=UPI000B8C0F3A|nr:MULTISPECIES: carbohydrate ABC transporter permease [unclassified Cohnella]OXS61665.1 sugar ABC transporter permease [Cohnella sp. CIP 111063]PRX74086.1 carbohydrate ABC transporter membrane protein 2 (CUT1 family) [Cohnella sp. SGD-V74]
MKNTAFVFLRLTAMAAIALVSVFPIYWMVMSSFRTHEEIFKYATLSPELFLPVKWTLQNYRDIFLDPSKPFGRYMLNTLLVAVVVTTLGLIVNALSAFAFAKLRFPFKRLLLTIFLSSLVIPYEVIMVPQYLLMRDFGWINSYSALIVPQIVWVFGIFMLIQFFSDVPRDILEAARIDGSGWTRIFAKIVLPTAVPALITLGLMTFLNQWDSFLWPLVVINEEKKQVIQVAISSFQSLRNISWGKILAATSISSVPILVVFLFLQKYYVQGITMSGVKG